MSKKKNSGTPDKRRAALRKLVVSGGIIGTAKGWSKPVVESIVMPAHAQTSDPLRDPCIIVIDPLGPTTYQVLVSGQVVGANNSGVPIKIKVTAGSQVDSDTAETGPNGVYGPDTFGPFDVCIDDADPVALVTSPSIPDSATCTVAHGKNIALC